MSRLSIVVYLLLTPLQILPWWMFCVLLAGVAVVYARFKRRVGIGKLCILAAVVLSSLLILSIVLQAPYRLLRAQYVFDHEIEPGRVTKYKFRFAGLGDTEEFWELQHVERDNCEQIVRASNLEVKETSGLLQEGWAPSWWPSSMEKFSVFQGWDEQDGSMEIWIAEDGSRVYLYRFLE